ncbi:MAG: recombinase family protein [Deltaproteobacteria bacterium]|nr:recombinase family protein [Deltaproteobacteria bacterium]
MQKALIYCRVSTEEQAERGYSLETQEKYCRQFAERNGYKIVGVYRDEGKSGKRLDRPALKDLLSRIQEDKSISAVIIQETDRLARNTKDHLTIRALLQKANVNLVSVAQPMLDDSPEGTMIDTIIASVNQFQSDINGRKTSKGMQEKFDSGWWPTWAPLGYINKEIRPQEKIIVPDQEKWHLVRKALKMYLTGNYSAIEIADILYQKGLRSRTGKKICNSVMTDILRNPFYAGIMRWKGQEKVGKHKAMITLEEHRRILRIFSIHNHHACRRRKYNFLLRGFVFCNICGNRYTAERHPAKKVSYYHCQFGGKIGKDRTHTNRGQNVTVEELERQVEEKFKDIQFSAEFISLVVKKMKELYSKQKEEIEIEKRGLLNQRLAIERKRDVAEEKLLSQIISDADFQRIRERIQRELTLIQDQLDELEMQHTWDVDAIREVLKLTQDIYYTYKTAPYELKREFLGLFWEKFLVQDKRIVEAIPNKLIQALIENRQVIISDQRQPSPKLCITLQDWEYMTMLKEKVRHIKRSLRAYRLSRAATTTKTTT